MKTTYLILHLQFIFLFFILASQNGNEQEDSAAVSSHSDIRSWYIVFGVIIDYYYSN